MKIVDLKVHVLKSPLAEPFAFSQGWVRQRSATLLEIDTDDGLVTWNIIGDGLTVGQGFPVYRVR